MERLERLLREASIGSHNSAVKYSRSNEGLLCRDFFISRQELRQRAEMIDKQTRMGYVAVSDKDEKDKDKVVVKRKERKKISKKKR